MKIGIFYFSGTGNTKKIIDIWIKSLEENSISYDLINIEKKQSDLNLCEYDKLTFVYPIHAFNAPLIMLDFAKTIKPLSKPVKAFFIMASGEYLKLNNISGNKLKRILKRRNIICESDFHYLMPYNMIFRHTEENAVKMYETAKRIIPYHVSDYILSGKIHKTDKIYILLPLLFFFRFEQYFSKLNGKFYKVDKDKCVLCMSCITSCPTNNIKYINNKFEFDKKCILCTRCSFSCPKDAFKIGLLNGWRVNKPYSFELPKEKEIDNHKNFCKRSYEKYYKEAEELIKAHSNDN